MSHIFDALQKSVAKNGDVELPSALLATQLLEATERKTAAARAMTAVLEEATLPKEIAEMLAPGAPVRTSTESPAENNEWVDGSAVDQFTQFPTLHVLVPPQSRLVCITDKESLAAEKFRYLSVRLRQLQQNRPLKKLLITSSIPEEGKSMVAANLACALAQRTRHRTLLMDGDLRRPSVAKLFGLGKIPGITEWLKGDLGPMTSIYHLKEAGLWVLPAGDSSRNPLELMQSGRLSGLMEQLTSWFDWIVIDSPPVLPLADTSIWMRLADGVLLVTRQGATEKKQLKRALEAIEQNKLLGALLNSSESTTNNYYYNEYRQMPPVDQSNGSVK
jgi:capsular exopolysaccharide synthesis family protein